MKSKLEQIEAARKAFQAYERAVTAAQEAIGDGPVHGLGTTVMVEKSNQNFECSECKFIGWANSWKFCPSCGSEIMRFERPDLPGQKISFVVVEPEPRPTKTIKVYSAKQK